jgi:beta-lactamase class A
MVAIAIVVAFAGAATAKSAANFLYVGSGELHSVQAQLGRSDIAGAQVVYAWRSLEPVEGQYDFAAIERDLALTKRLHKKLFIQIQDRFFSPEARNIPEYLLQEPQYDGGLASQWDHPGENKPVGSGWVAQQWNLPLRKRYQALLMALAHRFDGQVDGVNLPETAIDLDPKHPPRGYSCDAYFAAEMENLSVARASFHTSRVVQYVNFWPCEWNNDHRYMSRLFDFALRHDLGLGGPDIVPGNHAQMKNAYPFFHRYKGRLAYVAMAVQEPTLTYRNPRTGKLFTKEEFTAFASDFLGVDTIFWSTTAPWLEVAPAARVTGDPIDDAIEHVQSTLGGRVGVAIYDTGAARSWFHRADERFPMASTSKLLTCAALLHGGAGLLAASTTIRPGDLQAYSPVTKSMLGKPVSASELCRITMRTSDNTAANKVLEMVGGPKAVTAFVRATGDATTRLDRTEPEVNEATPGDLRDTTTPRAMADTVRTLVLDPRLTETVRKDLIDLMASNEVGGPLLRAGVPSDWRIADRTGAGGFGTRGIVAVMWPPHHAPVVVAIYVTETSATMDETNAAIASIGRAIALEVTR